MPPPYDAPTMPDARIAGHVELHAGLLRDPVDDALDVATLEVGAVGLDRAARHAEAAGIPGEDVVTVLVERVNAQVAEDAVARARSVGVAGLAPTRSLQHGRRAVRRGLADGEPVDADLGAVERDEVIVGGRSRHRGRDHGARRLPLARGPGVRPARHCRRRGRGARARSSRRSRSPTSPSSNSPPPPDSPRREAPRPLFSVPCPDLARARHCRSVSPCLGPMSGDPCL